jgi:hypothetical protein
MWQFVVQANFDKSEKSEIIFKWSKTLGIASLVTSKAIAI